MMIFFRVLNDYDIELNPLEHGIVSKNELYEITRIFYENTSKFYNSLNSKDKDIFIKEHMMEYLKLHKNRIHNKMIDRTNIIKDSIHDFNELLFKLREGKITSEDEFKRLFMGYNNSLSNIIYYMSSLNNHLVNGSKTMTEWISASSDMSAANKYFNNSTPRKVALMASSSKGLADENTLVLDLSNREILNKLSVFLSKKISEKDFQEFVNKPKVFDLDDIIVDSNLFNSTSKKFTGYNFSIADKEVCIYKYFKPEYVYSVLEELHLGLLNYKNVDRDAVINLGTKNNKYELMKVKNKLLQLVRLQNDSFMMHILNELYIKNNAIGTLNDDIDKINKAKKRILSLGTTIPEIRKK